MKPEYVEEPIGTMCETLERCTGGEVLNSPLIRGERTWMQTARHYIGTMSPFMREALRTAKQNSRKAA